MNNIKFWENKKVIAEIPPFPAELRIIKLLNDTKIEYFREVSFERLLSKKGFPLRFDFYFPKQNLLIEYDGYFHDNKNVTENDLIKNQFAIDNKIVLKRFDRSSWNDLEFQVWELIKDNKKHELRISKNGKLNNKPRSKKKKTKYVKLNGVVKKIKV